MTNSLRGEYSTVIDGAPHAFDTTLGTIARIEEACDGRSILDLLGGVVGARRAADQMALLAAALKANGHTEAAAARATVAEAEGFVLALMGALGFRLTPKDGEGAPEGQGPLPGSSAGDAGASSPSVA